MKIFGTLPQELEDEALANFDEQWDQIGYTSTFLLSLTPEDRQTKYSSHWNGLFYFVFGYAQAKGWTSAEKRMENIHQ